MNIKLKIMIVFVIFTFGFLTAAHGHAASSNETQYAPIINLSNQQIAGLAELTRSEQGVSVRLHGVNFNVYTGWIDIDNFADDDSQRILLRIAGGLSGDSNEITLEGNLSTGKIPSPDGLSIIFNNGYGVFENPMSAKIDFFVRTHGEIIPDKLVQQVTELEGGCKNNDCATFLFVSFDAPL